MVELLDLLSIEDYRKRFEGYAIRDCSVIERGLFFFVSEQHVDEKNPLEFNEEPEIRLTMLEPSGEKRWITNYMSGYGGLMVSGPALADILCVAVDVRAQVVAKKREYAREETDIPGGGAKDGPCRGAVSKIKEFNGRLYGCGTRRSLFYRAGPDQWTAVKPLPPSSRGEIGFDDFDGFSESDIYAVGGKGDVWHYDGNAWHKIPFPSNMWLHNVCCGADGHVYIGAQSGTVFRGRGDQWTMIHEGDLSLAFKDMVWFQDRVYATSDYGLWEIRDGRMQSSEAPIEITNCAGNLSVADGVMLLAGTFGAALHDGKSWVRLFSLIDLARSSDA